MRVVVTIEVDREVWTDELSDSLRRLSDRLSDCEGEPATPFQVLRGGKVVGTLAIEEEPSQEVRVAMLCDTCGWIHKTFPRPGMELSWADRHGRQSGHKISYIKNEPKKGGRE